MLNYNLQHQQHDSSPFRHFSHSSPVLCGRPISLPSATHCFFALTFLMLTRQASVPICYLRSFIDLLFTFFTSYSPRYLILVAFVVAVLQSYRIQANELVGTEQQVKTFPFNFWKTLNPPLLLRVLFSVRVLVRLYSESHLYIHSLYIHTSIICKLATCYVCIPTHIFNN